MAGCDWILGSWETQMGVPWNPSIGSHFRLGWGFCLLLLQVWCLLLLLLGVARLGHLLPQMGVASLGQGEWHHGGSLCESMAFGWFAGSWAGSVLEPAAHSVHMGVLLLGLGLWHLLGLGLWHLLGLWQLLLWQLLLWQLLLWQLLLLAQSWEAWLARGAKVERPTGCLASYGCNTIKDGFGPQSGNAKWQTQRKTTGCTST